MYRRLRAAAATVRAALLRRLRPEPPLAPKPPQETIAQSGTVPQAPVIQVLDSEPALPPPPDERDYSRPYAIRPLAEAPVQRLVPFAPRPYARPEPRLFNTSAALQAAVRHMTRPSVDARPAAVAEIENAIVLDEGLVVAGGDTIVRESMINRFTEPDIYVFRRTARDAADGPAEIRTTWIPGRNYVLLTQRWDGNYGHWLVESLPRLALLEGLYEKASLRFLILLRGRTSEIREVYRHSLAALGYREDQIAWYKGDLEVEHLIYPTPLTESPWWKSPICAEVLERVAASIGAGDPVEQPRRIYVSRNTDAWDRKLLNEDEIIAVAESRGYVVLHPGVMPFPVQVKSFAKATHVVGNLGAGCTNIAFAPRGVRFLALTTELMQDDFYWDLAGIKDGEYWSLHGAGAKTKPGFRDDFTIDPAEFADVLDKFHQAFP